MWAWKRTLKPEVISGALLLAWIDKAGVNSRVYNFHST